MLNMLSETAYNLILNYDEYQDKANSDDVTGNARMSIAIGLYYSRKLVKIITPKGIYDKPTRRTLKEGEKYNLDEYYNGEPVDKDAPYKGKAGEEHQWGPTLGPRSLRRSASSRAMWQILIIMPIEYAPFAKFNNLAKLMENMFDDLPNQVDYSIAYVRGTGGKPLPSMQELPF